MRNIRDTQVLCVLRAVLMFMQMGQVDFTWFHTINNYPLSYRVPVRERYGSTLLPATREQHDKTVHKVINKGLKTYV